MNLSHLKTRQEGLILAWRVDFRFSERYGAPLVFQRRVVQRKRDRIYFSTLPPRLAPQEDQYHCLILQVYTHKLEDIHHPVELCKPMNQYGLSHHRDKTYFLYNPNIWQIFNKTLFVCLFFSKKGRGWREEEDKPRAYSSVKEKVCL